MPIKEGFIPPRNKDDLTSLLISIIQNKRVAVYIDSANLYYATNRANIKIDYFHLARWFQTHCNLTKLNFYTAYDPSDERQQDFFTDLEHAGYTLIKKPIKVFADSVKGNMDIELAVDVLMQKNEYDTVVLLSGDSDFMYLVQALEKLKKRTIILGVGGFTSFELHKQADNYFFLNRIKSVWYKPQRGRKTRTIPTINTETINTETTIAPTVLHIIDQENTEYIPTVSQKHIESTLSSDTITTGKESASKSERSQRKAPTKSTLPKVRVKIDTEPKIIV